MRGIIFTSDNILTMLAERKTVTRRLAKTSLGTIASGRGIYKPGEIVYIKENFICLRTPEGKWDLSTLIYKVDVGTPEFTWLCCQGGYQCRAMFMPLILARYFIRILSARLEQLHDITDEDAVAEGIIHGASWIVSPREMYAALWDTINGKKTKFIANPMVYRYEFERVFAIAGERQ